MKRIAVCLLILTCTGACKKDDHLPDVNKYKYPIPQVMLTEDARVGAYYYQYKSSDWSKEMAYTPLLGDYNPLDPAVMDQQIIWADSASIDFFVFKWDGASYNSLLDVFEAESNKGKVKMVIDYSTAHLKATNDDPLEGDKLKQMVDELKVISDNYIKQSDYYQIDGRPVIMLSPLNLSSSKVNSIDYGKVADTLRSVMKGWGYDPYIIGEMTTGWVAPTNYPKEMLTAFDGIVLSTWKTNDYDRSFAFFSYSDLNYQNWKKTLEGWSMDYVPCIFPGYNSPTDSKGYTIERTEKNYTDYCNVAKRSMGKMRLVLINSWNDFKSGTQIEPAKEYGRTYLDITKDEFNVK
jgi:hypothetical protein